MDKHSRHLEWLAIAGLVQMQRQIALQDSSLKFQIEVEKNRQREKMLSVYVEEFRHRGFSPLQANELAENEVRVLEIMTLASEFAIENQHKYDNALAIVSQEKQLRLGLIPQKKYKSWSNARDAADKLKSDLKKESRLKMQKFAELLLQTSPSITFDDSEFRSLILGK